MARVFIDGFEAGDLKLWDTVSGATIGTDVTNMDGTYCLDCVNGAKYVQKVLPSSSEYYVAFRLRSVFGAPNYVNNIIYFLNGTTVLAYVKRNSSTGVIEVYRGTTYLASGTTNLTVNGTAFTIEVRYMPANSGGVFQVKVNGVLEIDYSGDTTDGATTIDKLQVGGTNSNIQFDNIVVDNSAWPGITKIQGIKPTGVGNSAQWTPSAGDNYACVDEVPASAADYVSTNTAGQLDTYAVGDLVGDIIAVKCVQVQALAMKEGAPTPLNIELALKSGVTTYLSADQAVPATTSKGLVALWELDPATGAPWEVAAVNAAEIGMKAVA